MTNEIRCSATTDGLPELNAQRKPEVAPIVVHSAQPISMDEKRSSPIEGELRKVQHVRTAVRAYLPFVSPRAKMLAT